MIFQEKMADDATREQYDYEEKYDLPLSDNFSLGSFVLEDVCVAASFTVCINHADWESFM